MMAGQQGQPKYGFGWPDGRLGGLGPPGQREARPLVTIIGFGEPLIITIYLIKQQTLNISIFTLRHRTL